MAGYFDSGNKLSQDVCAQSARNTVNQSISDYLLTSFRPDCAAGGEQQAAYPEFALQHANLRPTDGYGAPPACAIDRDSQLRNSPQVGVPHEDRRAPLPARAFHAGPNLGRGELLPTLEHVLVAGQPSARCAPVGESERDLPPLHPSMQRLVRSAANSTDAWALQFGEPSREVLRKMRAAHPVAGACVQAGGAAA